MSRHRSIDGSDSIAGRSGSIRVGIGGWSYAPWRETFYPEDLPQTKALEYASRQVTAIEINTTFYGTQKPETFAKWHEQTPEDFVFSLKAPRAATHRHDLDEGARAIDRFIAGGLDRLQGKLGPLLWQFPPSRRFDAEVFARFIERLPTSVGVQRLRHVLDVRHVSFASQEFVTQARELGVAIAYTDADDAPQIADITADFVYARLRRARSPVSTGYTLPTLKRWVGASRRWAEGGLPDHLRNIAELTAAAPRDCFIYFINGAKERAPAAATRLLELLEKA